MLAWRSPMVLLVASLVCEWHAPQQTSARQRHAHAAPQQGRSAPEWRHGLLRTAGKQATVRALSACPA